MLRAFAGAAAPGGGEDRKLRMRSIVEANTAFVARTLLNAGVPQSDLDDEIQRTFIVVAGRLEDVQFGAERSFVFQVAHNLAYHARRRLARCREVCSDELDDRIQTSATPERLTERKQMRELLDDIVDEMHESLRTVFTLYELEGMSMVEIAALFGMRRGTVASRLRRARAHIRQHLSAIELAWDLGTRDAWRIAGPALLRRQQVSTLERALLDIGASTPKSTSRRTKTRAALDAI